MSEVTLEAAGRVQESWYLDQSSHSPSPSISMPPSTCQQKPEAKGLLTPSIMG